MYARKVWVMKLMGMASTPSTNESSVPTKPISMTTGRMGRIRRLANRNTSEKLPILYKSNGKTKT